MLKLFPFSLGGSSKLYQFGEVCLSLFLQVYAYAKINAVIREIHSFSQLKDQSFHLGCRRFCKLQWKNPGLGMKDNVLLDTFYNTLTPESRMQQDSYAGNVSRNRTFNDAKELLRAISIMMIGILLSLHQHLLQIKWVCSP